MLDDPQAGEKPGQAVERRAVGVPEHRVARLHGKRAARREIAVDPAAHLRANNSGERLAQRLRERGAGVLDARVGGGVAAGPSGAGLRPRPREAPVAPAPDYQRHGHEQGEERRDLHLRRLQPRPSERPGPGDAFHHRAGERQDEPPAQPKSQTQRRRRERGQGMVALRAQRDCFPRFSKEDRAIRLHHGENREPPGQGERRAEGEGGDDRRHARPVAREPPQGGKGHQVFPDKAA